MCCLVRCSELKGELTRIRELVVLLGKAIGRQPGGAQLPGHDDPVWQKLGPLGGVSFALDTVIKHTRVRLVVADTRLRPRLAVALTAKKTGQTAHVPTILHTQLSLQTCPLLSLLPVCSL